MNAVVKNILKAIAIFAGIIITAVIIFLFTIVFYHSRDIEPPPPRLDQAAINELVSFTGLEIVAQNPLYVASANFVFNDTLVGLNYMNHKYFIQSLEDTGYLKFFEAREGPSLYRRNPETGRVSLYYAPDINYYKNNWLYFTSGGGNLVTHRYNTNGSHDTIATSKVVNITPFLGGGKGMLYYEGKLILISDTKLAIIDKNSAELLWEYKLKSSSLFIYPTIVGNKLVFVDYDRRNTLNTQSSTLVCVDLDSLKTLWKRTFPGHIYSGGGHRFVNNGNDIIAFRSSGVDSTKFINIENKSLYTLPLIGTTYFHSRFSYSNFFHQFVDDSCYVGGLLNYETRLVNFKSGDVKWEVPGTFDFIYNNFVVTRTMRSRQNNDRGLTTDTVYVSDIKTGEILKRIFFEIDEGPTLGGLFKFKERYILINDTFYK